MRLISVHHDWSWINKAPPHSVPGPQSSQAPLGFIQNDQGTLIVVYSSDALDQYVSGQDNGSSSGSNSSTSMQSTVQVSGLLSI